MSDTYSPSLKTRLIQSGTLPETWGAALNSDAISLLDSAIAGRKVITLTGITYSLGALTSGADAESRYMALQFIGAPAGDVTITIPSSVTTKIYLIDNQTSKNLIIGYATGSTVTVAASERRLVWCDSSGTPGVYQVSAAATTADALGGVAATNWQRKSRTAAEILASTVVYNDITVSEAYPWVTVADAATIAFNCNDGNRQSVTIAANRIIGAPTNPRDGYKLEFAIIQDGTGGRTITSWDSVFYFENGTLPTLGTAAGAVDTFEAVYKSSIGKWLVKHGYNVGVAAATTFNLTIDRNEVGPVRVFERVGSPAAAVTVNVTISAGVVIQAPTSGDPALDFSGFTAGSTINLTNNGYVLGRGGKGGRGAWGMFHDSNANNGAIARGPGNGRAGGKAILGPGASITFNITNANGHIWGGGGGGGGGGVSVDSNGSYGEASGGPGSGGAGSGEGADSPAVYLQDAAAAGWASNNTDPGLGNNGTTGPSGTFGASVAGNSSGAAEAGAGGAGGDWGTDGSDGGSPTSKQCDVAGGTKGTAGKAIELNGGGAPTWVSGSGAPNVKGAVS